jgi:hypothetical protein
MPGTVCNGAPAGACPTRARRPVAGARPLVVRSELLDRTRGGPAQPASRNRATCRRIPEWRDPDSNRGHHDFQGVVGKRVGAQNACKSSVSRSPRRGGVPLASAGFPRVWDSTEGLKSQTSCGGVERGQGRASTRLGGRSLNGADLTGSDRRGAAGVNLAGAIEAQSPAAACSCR